MVLLDGRKVSQELLSEVKKKVLDLKKNGVVPKLVIIMVGEHPSSISYIRQKRKACEQVGIIYEQINYSEEVATKDLISKVHELNINQNVHGILVQLPLPKHVYLPEVIKAIDPKKDVDGFHAYNVGKMFLSTEFERLAPCTPMGVIKLLEYYEIPIQGQEVTVVGHSNIVGKPLSVMLLNRNATVITCHVYTKDLKKHALNADILVVAVGKAGLITSDMVKDGVVVVDVGINKVGDTLVGDVDFEGVSKKASYITPVPGGVGPMTVACLMENVVKAALE